MKSDDGDEGKSVGDDEVSIDSLPSSRDALQRISKLGGEGVSVAKAKGRCEVSAERRIERERNEPEGCDELVERTESLSLPWISFSLHLGSPNELSHLLEEKGSFDVE